MATPIRLLRSRLPRRRTATAVVTAIAFVALFGTTAAGLFRYWASSAEYGHGLLLLPIALFLAWKRRLPPAQGEPAKGLCVLVGAVGLFLLGVLGAELFTRRFSLLLALGGLTVFFAGTRQLRAWWLPFGLLLLTLPLPEVVLNSVTFPLQLLASRVAVALLEFRHVPAALAGNIIFLPGQQLFVAEACSGLRSVSALLGLTLLIGGTGLATPAARLALLAVAVPAALAANAFRVFATGFAAYFWGHVATEGAPHQLAGVGVFVLAYSLVGVVFWGLRRFERGNGRPVTGRTGRGAGQDGRGSRREARRVEGPRRKSMVLLGLPVLPAVLFLLGVSGRIVVQPASYQPLRAPLEAIPAQLADYTAAGEKELSGAELRILKVDDYLLRRYRSSGGNEVTLFVAYYGRQRSGATIHSPRNCLPGAGWEPVEHERIPVRTPYGKGRVNRYIVEHRSGARALVFYWYQGRGRVAASEYAVKWHLVRDALLARRSEEALVRLVFPLQPGGQASPRLGLPLVEAVSRNLVPYLPAGA
ncbi:MAG: exosortase C-terminal domain/associated protein EpsI [Gemmatimonadota bacterium]